MAVVLPGMPDCSEERSSAASCARQPFPRHCCPRRLLLPQPHPLLCAPARHGHCPTRVTFSTLTFPLSLAFQRLANAAEKFQKAHHWQDNIRVRLQLTHLPLALLAPELPEVLGTLTVTLTVTLSMSPSCSLSLGPSLLAPPDF